MNFEIRDPSFLDLTPGGSSSIKYTPFKTYALMLAAGLNNGDKAAVTQDPDKTLNGRYTALKDLASLPVDLLKEHGPFKIKDWKPDTDYTQKDLIYDPILHNLYIAYRSFKSNSIEIKEDLKHGDLRSIGGSGLRGDPVKNETELKAILAKDFELREVLGTNPGDDDIQYVFKLGSGPGDIPDNAGTGFWNKVDDAVSARFSERVATANKKTFDTPFKMQSAIVFRDGLIAENNTWTIKTDSMGIKTLGEVRNTIIDILNISSFSKTIKFHKVTVLALEDTFDVGSNMDKDSIIVFKNGRLLQPDQYEFDIAKPSIVSFTSGLPMETTITILYKRIK